MKKIRIVAALLILLSLTSCSSIEDSNGADDTTLSSITEDQILGRDMGWNVFGLKENKSRLVTRNSDYYSNEGFYESDDYDFYKVECKSASGITNLIATKSEGESEKISFTVSSNIEEGNLKVVLVKRGDEEDELIYEFITGEQDLYELTVNELGIYYIRAALESFKGEITVSRDFADGSN